MNRLNYSGVSPIMPGNLTPTVGFGSDIQKYGSPYGPAPGPFSNQSSMGSPIASPAGVGLQATPSMSSMSGPSVASRPPPRAPYAASSVDTAKVETGKPGIFGEGGFFGEDGFKLNDLGTLTEIIGGFGNIWNGIQMNKLAKETLAFQKDSYNTNLANSIKSYNLALSDRMGARYAQNNRTQAEADAAIAANRL